MIFKRRPRQDDPVAAIAAFWAWWPSARPRVERAAAGGAGDDLTAEMNERIAAIHPHLAWEFRPAAGTGHLLTVSADGDRSLRAVAERWRRAAPAPDASFGYASSRQPSPAALDATLEIDDHKVDLAEMRFAADVDTDAAQIDVRVWHPEFPALPARSCAQVTFRALDWLLGEDAVEIWLRGIEPATASGPALTASRFAATVAALAGDGAARWTVLRGERRGRPALATVQVPLRAARWPAADTHVRLEARFAADPSGLPTRASLTALRSLEEHIRAYADGPVLVAHETSAGVRVFHLYADRPAAVDALRPIVAGWPTGRIRLTAEPDPFWAGVSHLTP